VPLVLELGAAAAASLFAIHPLRVESVAWITERRDVLSTLFLLLAAIFYLRAFPPRSTSHASVLAYSASVVFLLLSLLSKAWGMSFFVLVLILDWYPLHRLPSSPLAWFKRPALAVLLQKLPYAALGIAFAIQAARAQASVAFTAIPLEQWPVGARILQAGYGLMFYIQKLVWPSNLAALYELEPFKPLAQPRFIIGAVFAIAFVAAAVFVRRRLPAFTAAALAYAIILSPVLGFSQSGSAACRGSVLVSRQYLVGLGRFSGSDRACDAPAAGPGRYRGLRCGGHRDPLDSHVASVARLA
jgi:hypothetical protein